MLEAMLIDVGRGAAIASNTLASVRVDISISYFIILPTVLILICRSSALIVHAVGLTIVSKITLSVVKTRCNRVIECTSLNRYLLILLYDFGLRSSMGACL